MMENIVWGIIIGCVSAVSLAMLLSVAKDHWQSKKEKVEDTFVPSGKTVFFTIDWVQGMVFVSTPSILNLNGEPAILAQTNSNGGAVSYYTLAMRLISNCISVELAAGLSESEAIAEVKSWNLVVSASGRAHNALLADDVHCTVKLYEQIRHAKSVINV